MAGPKHGLPLVRRARGLPAFLLFSSVAACFGWIAGRNSMRAGQSQQQPLPPSPDSRGPGGHDLLAARALAAAAAAAPDQAGLKPLGGQPNSIPRILHRIYIADPADSRWVLASGCLSRWSRRLGGPPVVHLSSTIVS